MARTVRDTRLETRSARLKLPERREPYWRSIQQGLAVGYRKGAKGGYWIARRYARGDGRHYESLGIADDTVDANAVSSLSFDQAQAKARAWFADLTRKAAAGVAAGPYSVSNALDDYIADYARRSGKATDRLRYTVEAHIRPALGQTDLAKLTHNAVKSWFNAVTDAAPRVRSSKGQPAKHRARDKTAEGIRRRRSAANRILTTLKAALNYAVAEKKAASDEAWRNVKPHEEADAPKVRYLVDDEIKRLVNACPEDLRKIVMAAILTGLRYGEIAVTKARDFDANVGTIHVPVSKSGKSRHVALTDEGLRFFKRLTAGLSGGDLVFRRSGGGSWGRAHQSRPLAAACKIAKINPPASFHILRHSYASRLAMRGVPMGVIAAQLGHEGTRMTETYYAHLAPSYVSQTVRAAFGDLGLATDTNVNLIPLTGRSA